MHRDEMNGSDPKVDRTLEIFFIPTISTLTY